MGTLFASVAAGLGLANGLAQVPSDPSATDWLTSLGPAAAVCVALWLWRMETSRRLDQALELDRQRGPFYTRTEESLRQVGEAMQASVRSTEALTEALKQMPSSDQVTRMTVALEKVETLLQPRAGPSSRGRG